MTKTITIHHPEYGWVEGVTYKKIELLDPEARAIFCGDCAVEGWMSPDKGCLYLKSGGWKEVLPKRDVTGEVELGKDHSGYTMFLFDKKDADLSPDITFTKSKAVVLPDGMSWEEWTNKYYHSITLNLDEVLAKNATEVIQVFKEGE